MIHASDTNRRSDGHDLDCRNVTTLAPARRRTETGGEAQMTARRLMIWVEPQRDMALALAKDGLGLP
jgi:hypothetical protein